MKIFSSEQIKDWDNYTISHKPIASIDLMEQASLKAADWIMNSFPEISEVVVLCGPGNNGGDGLAIARILSQSGFSVVCFIVKSQTYSDDFQTNLERLEKLISPIFLENISELNIAKHCLIVDALFGHGLNRPLSGLYLEIVKSLSEVSNTIISIDMPSGMFSDKSGKENQTIKADFTLTFQTPKLGQLLPENGNSVGELVVLDIGLSPEFSKETTTSYHFLDETTIREILKPRYRFGHKGTFGKSLVIAGSKGSMGAAVLCAKACYRSGVGLVYALVPECGVDIMQISLPEAVVFQTPQEVCDKIQLKQFSSIGIGPGISEDEGSVKLLKDIFRISNIPLVIDASALNLIASNTELFELLPNGSILTPHPKEFERLAGKSENDFERLKVLKEKANTTQCIWILKGAHTAIALPNGEVYFNSTGNSGMATGGSGDVLTGIITGLLAQGYKSEEAAILGVYLHGYAGEKASKRTGLAPLLASDIIEGIKDFFLDFES